MVVMVFQALLVLLVELSTKILMVQCKIHYKENRAKRVNKVYLDSQVMTVPLVLRVFQVKTDHVEKTAQKVTLDPLVNEVIQEAWVDSYSRNTVKLNKFQAVRRAPFDYGMDSQ